MAVTFTDSDGVVWDAWEVNARSPRSPNGHETKLGDVEVPSWLCFMSVRGKRRLMPFPKFWALLPPSALERLCAEGTPVHTQSLHVCADSLVDDTAARA
jgi:hypothetical protein